MIQINLIYKNNSQLFSVKRKIEKAINMTDVKPESSEDTKCGAANTEDWLDSLEKIVGRSCFCKLRESCPDKKDSQCLKERNIYKEFMQEHH